MHNLYSAKRLVADLGIEPFYAIDIADEFLSLNPNEHAVVFSPSHDQVAAFTSPIADLMFRDRLRYEWRGRGFCCIYRQSVLQMTEERTLGVTIHEAGHYVEACNRQERDDTNHDRAIKAFWQNGLMGADGGHNARWIRATVHLWWRAIELGYEVHPEAVMQLDRYGWSPTSEYVNTLISEATAKRTRPIEAILATPPPAAFSRLFASDTGKTPRRSAKPSAKRTRTRNASLKRQGQRSRWRSKTATKTDAPTKVAWLARRLPGVDPSEFQPLR